MNKEQYKNYIRQRLLEDAKKPPLPDGTSFWTMTDGKMVNHANETDMEKFVSQNSANTTHSGHVLPGETNAKWTTRSPSIATTVSSPPPVTSDSRYAKFGMPDGVDVVVNHGRGYGTDLNGKDTGVDMIGLMGTRHDDSLIKQLSNFNTNDASDGSIRTFTDPDTRRSMDVTLGRDVANRAIITKIKMNAPKKLPGALGVIAPVVAFGSALMDKQGLADAGGAAAEAAVNNLDPFITTTMGSNDMIHQGGESYADKQERRNNEDPETQKARKEYADEQAEKNKQKSLEDARKGNTPLHQTIDGILRTSDQKSKISNPVSDIVDSYYICKYLYQKLTNSTI